MNAKKQVTIVGFGLTGFSCLNFFLKKNIVPRVMDTRKLPPMKEKLPENIPYCFGELNEKWLLNSDLVVVSPGISVEKSSILSSISKKIETIGDIELFAREVKKPVVAITGSNGKSTVTKLVGEMAIQSGLKTGIGGNIGYPALYLLNKPKQIYVLELSSFQLETIYSLRPIIATVLNISEDHMDRYPFGMEQYRSIKLKIYKKADKCLINSEDLKTFPNDHLSNRYISFGNKSGDYHLKTSNGRKYLFYKHEKLINCQRISMYGRNNFLNSLASLAIADEIGIPRSISLSVLKKFKGLRHRLELIHEEHGIRWINDSKSTNVGSTRFAIESIHVRKGATVHLLLGGDGKSSDLSSLKSSLEKFKIKIYCFGKDAEKLASLQPKLSVINKTLEKSMNVLSKRLKRGDLVLLSPACSSLDQFKNFEERGNIFTDLAKNLRIRL